MLNQLLMIIVYVFAFIAGLIIVLMTAFCLCPMSYRIKVRADEKKKITVCIKLMAGLLACIFSVEEKERKSFTKVFGHSIKRNTGFGKHTGNKADSSDKKDADNKKTLKRAGQHKVIKNAARELTKTSNRSLLKKIADMFLKLAYRLKPKSSEGSLIFGMDNPCHTAIAYSVISYGVMVTGSSITVVPNMEKMVFQADVTVEGSILPGYIIYLFLCFILNKDIKSFLKKIRRK